MRLYIILIAAALSFSSCEKEVKLDLPEHKSGLVLHSYTEINQPIHLQVGKSVSVQKYTRNSDLSVSNATVILYKDGVAFETMHYDPTEGQYKSSIVAEHGKTYNVAVSAPNFTTAEASSIVPSLVPIIGEPQRFQKVRVDEGGSLQDEIRIKFDDPATTGDFYIVRINARMSLDSQHYYGGFCVNTPDRSVESIYNEEVGPNVCLSSDGIFMRDVTFNGTTKELRLYIQSQVLEPHVMEPGGDSIKPVIELYHVPEAYFRYLKTYQFAMENSGNPFSEPTNVYSNVKNGYGIFSIASYDRKEIK